MPVFCMLAVTVTKQFQQGFKHVKYQQTALSEFNQYKFTGRHNMQLIKIPIKVMDHIYVHPQIVTLI